MFGICVILLLLIIGPILTWLLVSKKKGKERSQAVNEGPKPLEAVYEDPDADLSGNFQPSFAQNKEVRTADNVAYSTQVQVLQDKEVTTADNVAYSTQLQVLQDKEVRTDDNVAYFTQLQVLQDEEINTQDNLAYGVVSTIS